MKRIRLIYIVFTITCQVSFSQDSNPALPPIPITTTWEFQNNGTISESIPSVTSINLENVHPNPHTFSIQTTSIVSEMLNNIEHPWIPPSENVYVINAERTFGYTGKRLFADDLKIDIEGIYIAYNPDYTVSFMVDKYWDRIVFSQKSGNWIKSYGDHDGEYHFRSPEAMSIDINDTIYVTDTQNGKIVKLVFDRATNTLQSNSSLGIADLIHPIDIAIDQCGSLGGTPSTDNIWILDDGSDQIITIRRNGMISQRISYYTNGQATFPLTNVTKIQTQEISGGATRLGFIDKNLMAFVIIQPPSNTIVAFTPFDPVISDLSCIGLDVNNEWWVGDEKAKLYHHFTKNGQYLASYSSASTMSGEFDSPVTISKAPYYKLGSTIYRSQYIFTSDKWGSNTGIRAFLPGAAILNPPVSFNNNYSSKLPIPFMLTNRSHVKAKLAKYVNSEWTVFKEFDPIIMEANPNAVYYLDNLFMGTGSEFRIFLEYCPAYQDVSSWSPTGSVTIPVYNNYISTYNLVTIVPVSPTSICTEGNGGTYEANTLYNGPFTYTWYRNGIEAGTGKTITLPYVCPGTVIKCSVKYKDPGNGTEYVWDGEYTNCQMNITINGPTSLTTGQVGTWSTTVNGGAASSSKSYQWHYQPSGSTNWTLLSSNQSATWTMGSQNIKLRCDIQAYSGSCTQSATSTITVRVGTTPSCPYVYTWDGNSFREDNNILPQSEYEENAGKDVNDYYRLLKPLKQKNGNYILRIREFENELSYFDEFKLIAIDHPSYSKIDVSPSSGEVYHYVTPYKLNKANFRNQNVIAELAEFDSSRIIVEPGDTIHLSLQQPIEKSSAYTLQSTLPGGEEGGGDGLPKTQKMAYNGHPNYLSGLDGVLTFRQKPTLVFVPATLDSLKSLNVVWTHRARLDYLNYGVMIPTSYLKRTLPLVSARHSSRADVKEKVSAMDSIYALLSPNEFIELQFQSLPLPPAGTKRTFVLYSRGRYEQLSDSSIIAQNLALQISEFQIDNIYPNPFNPTTKISFRQPTDGYARIIIYDVIGREVAHLADANISSGIHEVTWDAGNNASGIYFCRYTVSNSIGTVIHQEVKKLILTR